MGKLMKKVTTLFGVRKHHCELGFIGRIGDVLTVFVVSVLSAVYVSAANPEPKPVWNVKYFADNSFMRPGGETTLTTTNVMCEVRKFQYPQFVRKPDDLRAFVACGRFIAESDGVYAFRLDELRGNNAAARLQVDGKFINEFPDGEITLKKGEVPVRVYVRQSSWTQIRQMAGVKFTFANFGVSVKAPGKTDFAPIVVTPSGELPHDHIAFDREFKYDEAIKRYYCYRSFPIDVEEDGYYRIGIHFRYCTFRSLRFVLDEQELFQHHERAGTDMNSRFTGEVDMSGNRKALKADFFTRQADVRLLKKGRHMVDLYMMQDPWPGDNQVALLMTNDCVRCGYDILKGVNPESETGFWIEDRDDAVYEKGETFELRGGSAADAGYEYLFEVSNTVSHAIVKRETAKIGYKPHDFKFACETEGAYEYRVYNRRGEVVEGPWAFVVVDTAPVERAKMGKNAKIPAAGKIADSVDCAFEGPGGPHEFRDSFGSSSVVTNRDGLAYRLVGPQRAAHKLVTHVGKPGTAEFNQNNYRILTDEEIKAGKHGQYMEYFDWYAYTLNVPNPGKPYIVRCTIPNDENRYVTSYAFDRKTAAYNGWNLHCGDAPAAGPTSYLSYFVWPNADKIDVMIPNTTGNHGGRLNRRGACVKIELLECGDEIPQLPEAALGWTDARGLGWHGEQGDLWVNERTMPPMWESDSMLKIGEDKHGYHSWNDLLLSWERFGQLCAYRGDSLVMGPVFSYGMQLYQGPASRLLYPGVDVHGKGAHSEIIDRASRDQFKLILMKCSKWGVKFVADFMIYIPEKEGPFWATQLGMPSETNSIFLSPKADGVPYRPWTGALVNNPAHPVYRKIAIQFCEELAKRYGKYPAFAGIRQRYWPDCVEGFDPWWHDWRLGFDDWTVAKFAEENGIKDPKLASVGRDETAFDARRTYMTNQYETVLRDWRDDKVHSLREEMVTAMRKYRPDACLFVLGTNVFKSALGLGDKRVIGRRDLGYLAEQGGLDRIESVEMNSLSGKYFAAFNTRPAPYDNPDHGTNEWLVHSYPSGLCCNKGYRCSPYHLEPIAKRLADNQLKYINAGGEWCLPPADEKLREFTQIYRAIPDLDYTRFITKHGADKEAPYGIWQAKMPNGGIALFVVNATDCELDFRFTLSARNMSVTDPVDGSKERFTKEVHIRLDSFMPAVRFLSGNDGVASVDVAALGAGLKRIQDEAERLISYESQCGKYCGNRNDENRTFSELIAPLKAAYAGQDWLLVKRCLFDFRRDHDYWLMVTGFPKEENNRTRPCGNTLKWMHGKNLYVMKNTAEDGEFAEVKDFESHGEFFVSKKGYGPFVEIGGGWGGWRTASFTALFGGGYGPYQVEDRDGKVIWTFPATGEERPHLETRTIPMQLNYHFANSLGLRYRALGENGGAVLSAASTALPGPPVTKFYKEDGSIFKTGADGYFEPPAGMTNLIVYAVKNGPWGLTTTFLDGVDRVEVMLNGKPLIKRAEKRSRYPTSAHTSFVRGTNRFDLVISPAPEGAKSTKIMMRIWEAEKVEILP